MKMEQSSLFSFRHMVTQLIHWLTDQTIKACFYLVTILSNMKIHWSKYCKYSTITDWPIRLYTVVLFLAYQDVRFPHQYDWPIRLYTVVLFLAYQDVRFPHQYHWPIRLYTGVLFLAYQDVRFPHQYDWPIRLYTGVLYWVAIVMCHSGVTSPPWAIVSVS